MSASVASAEPAISVSASPAASATCVEKMKVAVVVAKRTVCEELQRIAKTTDLWDGKVCNLQVTNCTEGTVELRALLSASNAGRAWDLRCLVREELIAYLQREQADALPRARAEVLSPEPCDSRQPAGDSTAGRPSRLSACRARPQAWDLARDVGRGRLAALRAFAPKLK